MKATLPAIKDYHPESKVWIYASTKELNQHQKEIIQHSLNEFTKTWTAHDVSLRASGWIEYDRFIVLCVDESKTGASGCSIDKSVHFIQELENEHGLSLFDRLNVYYFENGRIEKIHFTDLQNPDQNVIKPETLIIDTSVSLFGVYKNDFVKKASKSWVSKYLR